MGIKYSDNMKRPDQEFEYTADLILELGKCEEDVWNFLKHIKIIHPDRGVIKFEPYDFQKQILRNLQDNRFNVILASRQSGKCFFYSTFITVKNKKTGEIQEISVGELFDKMKK